MARYLPDGSLDQTLGTGGKILGSNFSSGSVALQADSKIVVAGTLCFFDPVVDFICFFVVTRYNADGSLDPTFGAGGRVITDFGGRASARAITVQPDGKIVAAGDFSPAMGTSPPRDFALARYNANGSLDTTFGSGGRVTTDFGLDDSASALALQPDGKIVVVGFSGPFGSRNFALARYRGDPTLYLRLTPNQTTFSPGDPLEIDTAEANSGPDTMIDRYLGAVLPPEVGPAFGCAANDAVAFVTETLGLVLTCLSAPPQTFPPFRRNVLIPADLPLTVTDNVFNTMWPVGAPGGTYVLFMADVLSGAVADGSLDPGDLPALATAAVQFMPSPSSASPPARPRSRDQRATRR